MVLNFLELATMALYVLKMDMKDLNILEQAIEVVHVLEPAIIVLNVLDLVTRTLYVVNLDMKDLNNLELTITNQSYLKKRGKS